MVVVFHAGLPVPGGFVGVDIFFVISGFVITAMLHREWLSNGRIRFGQFYLRRFKRLTPALALMVTVTIILSTVILSPFGDQPTAAMTGIGAMLLAANFVIARTTGGYFDAPAETNPLLNTWSLSVEEQFYLVFPAIIVFGWYLARRNGLLRMFPYLIVGGISVFSFGLAIAGSTGWTLPAFSDTILGFYSPFTRAWEFAVGALLALALAKGNLKALPKLMFSLGLIGIGMLVASLWLITDITPFPGKWTLLPVSGTLLLLLAGAHSSNPISRSLSSRPMVKIGDWSYSIYLWHWPLIVFAVYLWPFTPYAAVLAAIISIAPAVASYRWVEQPIRIFTSPSRIRWATLISFVMIPPVLFAGAAGAAARFYWQPQLMSGELSVIHQGDTDWTEYYVELEKTYYPCADTTIRSNSLEWEGMTRCIQSEPGAGVEVALVGDSHAEHLFIGLVEAFPTKNIAFYIQDSLPIENTAEMTTIINHVAESPSIQTVVVNASWAARGVPETELIQTLNTFVDAGLQVFITDDVPQYPFPAYVCKHGVSPFMRVAKCSQPLDRHEAIHAKYSRSLESVVSQVPGVVLLNSAQYFCDDEACSMIRNGELMYRDTDHLNNIGSRFLTRKLLEDNPGFRNALSSG